MNPLANASYPISSYVNPQVNKCKYAGTRLVVLTYKSDKEGIRKPSICVEITTLSSEIENLAIHANDRARKVITKLLELEQNKLIKSYIDSRESPSSIPAAAINLNAILQFCEEETTSARLTKEMIAEWFNETIQDSLLLLFADKLGIEDAPTAQQAAQLEAATKKTAELFSNMAGGRTTYNKEVAQKLLNVLKLVPYSSLGDIGEKLFGRLEMMSKKDAELLDLL